MAFRRFVLFAEMRTGSNFLESALNAAEGVTCYGEAFNPVFVGYPKLNSLFGFTLSEREADPLRLLEAMSSQPGLNGFRYFHDHDPRVLEPLLDDPACAKIILLRNPAESYVSLGIARATGQWKLGNARQRREAKAVFDEASFHRHIGETQEFQQRLMRGLQLRGQSAFYIHYDDLGDLAVLNGLLAWLGAPGRLSKLPDDLVRQNPEPLSDKVENFEEMQASLARLDRFDLSRTPMLEPRRSAVVPSWVAAAEVPLLHLPVRAAPDAEVAAWLEAVGGGLVTSMDQKALRLWQRQNKPRRVFTVLRHPLKRAWVAFEETILSGRYHEICQTLREGWKVPLAKPGAQLAPEKVPEAFAAFLTFLKANLAGQTSVRVDPFWASQAAVVQGFASVLPPDRILREEDMPEALPALAAELGAASPAPPQPRTMPDWLDDRQLRRAAAEAYARDMHTFGFDRA